MNADAFAAGAAHAFDILLSLVPETADDPVEFGNYASAAVAALGGGDPFAVGTVATLAMIAAMGRTNPLHSADDLVAILQREAEVALWAAE